jgi:hypothetical protein
MASKWKLLLCWNTRGFCLLRQRGDCVGIERGGGWIHKRTSCSRCSMSACIERRSSRLPLFLSLMADYERPCACPTVIDPSPVSPERFFEVLDRATHHRETFLYQAKKCEIEQERRGWIWRRKKRFRLCSGAGRLLFFFLFSLLFLLGLYPVQNLMYSESCRWIISLVTITPCAHKSVTYFTYICNPFAAPNSIIGIWMVELEPLSTHTYRREIIIVELMWFSRSLK